MPVDVGKTWPKEGLLSLAKRPGKGSLTRQNMFKQYPLYSSQISQKRLWLYSPWRRQWHLTPVLLPGKSHGRRRLVGGSPWGLTELDTTERLHFHFSLSCIGDGNGNPLQCFCLENPRDGEAWWAAVYGVAQSQTRLKWLSSILPYHTRNDK